MNERLSDRQFDFLSVTVAATLATHVAHLPAWLIMALAIMLPLRAWTRRRGAQTASAWIRLPLTALLFILVLKNFGNVFGREPGSVLGCGLLALKLLEAERFRDARVALGFCAFVLMSALLFTQTMVFTLLICAVLVLLLAALNSMQPALLETPRPLRACMRVAALLLGAGLPLAAASFVLIPRLGTPLWGAPGDDGVSRTGITDHMEPGSITELLVDDSPAFRVNFDASPLPAAQLYFRAIVLWNFDGVSWTRERARNYGQPEEAISKGAPIDYQITLEATAQRWLPALDLPLTAPDKARLGTDRGVVADEPVSQPRQYRMRSSPSYVLAPTLAPSLRARALALPAGFDPKTRALAENWRSQGLGDAEIVRAALDRFHASFTYTLSPPPLGRDSIDDFLFDTQRGFCEHYSSAFVFLMRAAGIPARVVTGYQGGWWNASGNYLLVRQSDAHAWAEVWREDIGWQRIDPTAAVSPTRIELGAAAANGHNNWSQSEWLRGLRNQFDFANRLWTQGIIRFDALRQKGMLTPFGINDANQGDLLLALSCVLGVMMLVAAIWAMRGNARLQGDAIDRAWARLGDRLARTGIARKFNEGPLDLLQRTRGVAPRLVPTLAPLVDEYIELRYGAVVGTPQRVAAFATAIRKFRLPRQMK